MILGHHNLYPDLVITSINDSTHGTNSRHYTDEAVDIRSHNFSTKTQKIEFVRDLRALLGPVFTVLHESIGTENEHFHIQVAKGQVYEGL